MMFSISHVNIVIIACDKPRYNTPVGVYHVMNMMRKPTLTTHYTHYASNKQRSHMSAMDPQLHYNWHVLLSLHVVLLI